MSDILFTAALLVIFSVALVCVFYYYRPVNTTSSATNSVTPTVPTNPIAAPTNPVVATQASNTAVVALNLPTISNPVTISGVSNAPQTAVDMNTAANAASAAAIAAGFANGQVVMCPTTGAVYLIGGGQKLWYPSPAVYASYGSPPAANVNCAQLAQIPSGPNIQTAPPTTVAQQVTNNAAVAAGLALPNIPTTIVTSLPPGTQKSIFT